MVLCRRPHLSEKMDAGIVTLKMMIADTPEARNEASEDLRPAWAKRRGAYWGHQHGLHDLDLTVFWTYIENAVDAAQLLHPKEKDG